MKNFAILAAATFVVGSTAHAWVPTELIQSYYSTPRKAFSCVDANGTRMSIIRAEKRSSFLLKTDSGEIYKCSLRAKKPSVSRGGDPYYYNAGHPGHAEYCRETGGTIDPSTDSCLND